MENDFDDDASYDSSDAEPNRSDLDFIKTEYGGMYMSDDDSDCDPNGDSGSDGNPSSNSINSNNQVSGLPGPRQPPSNDKGKRKVEGTATAEGTAKRSSKKQRQTKPPLDDEDEDDEEDYDDEMMDLADAGEDSTRKPKTTRQTKRASEQALRSSKRMMNNMKQRNTLIRACKPRARRNIISDDVLEAPAKNEVVSLARLPVETTHEAHLQKLEDAVESAEDEEAQQAASVELEQYVSNYMMWQSALMEAQSMVQMNSNGGRNNNNNSSSSSSSVASSSTSLCLDQGENTLITAFFKPKPECLKDRVNKYFKDFYYNHVLESERNLVFPRFQTIDDLRAAVQTKPKVRRRTRRSRALMDMEQLKREMEERVCSSCGGEQIIDSKNGHASCMSCGLTSQGTFSYKTTFSEMQASSRSAAPYEEMSHFKEFITRLEGSERTEIPEKVINILLKKCATNRIDPIKEPHKITAERVREFLKQTGYSHFNENVPQIMSKLTHAPCKTFTRDQRETLNKAFKEILEPYNRHKGKRRNLISYSFITYKICQLLGFDEFLPLLHLLRPKNLLSADAIWKKICEDLNYEFIPTI